MDRYLRILRRRGAGLPFLSAVVARLPIAMGPLGMVLLVQHVRGNYSIAGVVTAAFAVGSAVGAPGWGRLMDDRGQPWVVGPLSVVSAVLLAALSWGAVSGRSDAVLIALAASVGLTFPPVSPAMRGAWRVVLETDADRSAAYALDTVAVETIFVGGPLLLSLLLGPGIPALPLLVTAALMALGGVGYALTRAARGWRAEPHASGAGHRSASPLRDGSVVRVLGVTLGLAVGFGVCDLAIAATAREVLGQAARVGLLFAAIAGGSATGGLWYGTRAWKQPERRRLSVALAGFTTGLVGTSVLVGAGLGNRLLLVLPGLFATGLFIAPGLIVLANLIDHHGPVDRLGEAQSWLNTAFTAGGALGTAVAGVAVDRGGPALGFGVSAVAVGLALLGSLAAARRFGTPA